MKKEFTMKHKYCGMTITVLGTDKYTVYGQNSLDPKVWAIV